MKIMCMGDSITYGSCLTELSDRWSDLVATRTGNTMVNLGIAGDNTNGMLARCQTQVFAKVPDLLHVLGGTNDIWFTYDYHQAFSNIVSMIRHAETFEIPILIGIPTPFIPERIPNQEWVADRDSEYITQQCEKFAQALRAFCTMRDVPYVDYRNAFLNEDGSVREDMFADGLHPNGKGHVAMAEVLCQRLNELFPTKQ